MPFHITNPTNTVCIKYNNDLLKDPIGLLDLPICYCPYYLQILFLSWRQRKMYHLVLGIGSKHAKTHFNQQLTNKTEVSIAHYKMAAGH